MRRIAPVLALAAIALLPDRPLPSCTQIRPTNTRVHEGFVPAGAEFRMWAPDSSEFRMELRDARDRVVAADVVAHLIPIAMDDGMYQGGPWRYIALKPRARLAPGEYRFFRRVGSLDYWRVVDSRQDEGWRFTVASGTWVAHPTAPPAVAPGGLRAAVLRTECVTTEVNVDCSPVRGDCAFLVLDFTDSDQGEGDVYDVRWTPVVRGKPDAKGSGGGPGYVSEAVAAGRAIRIPVWALGRLDPAATAVRIEVRAVDAEGKAGPPAITGLDAAQLRAVADKTPTSTDEPDERPVEDRYAQDIARFARAADAESAPVFQLLAVVPRPPAARPTRPSRVRCCHTTRASASAGGSAVMPTPRCSAWRPSVAGGCMWREAGGSRHSPPRFLSTLRASREGRSLSGNPLTSTGMSSLAAAGGSAGPGPRSGTRRFDRTSRQRSGL